jgi:hypothetical protein
MGKAMATASEIQMRARLRRYNIYRTKKATGKTDKELGKEFGVSPSQINHLCRMVQYELDGLNFKEERNERCLKYWLRKLVPITDQIKGLTGK